MKSIEIKIREGNKPSKILRDMRSADPDKSIHDIAWEFCECFSELSNEANQVIWHWQGGKRGKGFNDAELDDELMKLFRDAGYDF